MWKVNGIEIETTAGRQKISPKQNGNSRKTDFFHSLGHNSETKRNIVMGRTGVTHSRMMPTGREMPAKTQIDGELFF